MAVSIGKLRQGNEDYVLRAVARGQEDYYLGSGEAPGRWLGGGAEELGLVGEVDAEVFRRVLAGQSPAGEQLVVRKQAGFDLTFSPPKSVSVLWGLGDNDVARAVHEAHREAVAAAVGYMESQAAVVAVHKHKRGPDARELRRSSGFVAAAFDHRTSRAGDPQLHTHVVIANMAKAEGDKWRALGRHPDLYRHAKAADALYLAELRRLLTERLGVEWTWDDDHPEVLGVPAASCDYYSKRHKEALAAVAEQGLDASPKAMQAAVLSSRRPKPGHRPGVEWSDDAGDHGVVPAGAEGLRDRWQREAREAGLPALDMSEILARPVEHEVDLESVSAELAGPHGLTEQRATFSRRDVVQAFAKLPGVGALDALRLADEWLASGAAVCLGSRHLGAEERWTTWDLLAQEDHLLWAARERANAGVGVVDAEVVETMIAGRGLSAEQAEMVRQLTTSGRGVECVVGRAGVGKTFALDAAREAWESEGITVLGTALSAAAAGELRKGAKVTAATIARQIIDNYRDGLPEGCVLVVDEAGMVDTRSLATLSRAVERADGKLVLVGDDKQLPSIQAGGTFARLVEAVGAVELTEVRRQASEADREALAEVRHGDLAAGLRALVSRDGRNVVAKDASGKHLAMVSDWAEARQQGKDVLMLARSRRRVEELAAAAREARRRAGELGAEELTVKLQPEPVKRRSERVWMPDSRSFSPGDEVLFTRNTTGRWKHLKDSMPGVHNGKAGVVTGVDKDAGTITVRLAGDAEAEARWQAARARQEQEIRELTARLDAAASGETTLSAREVEALRRRLARRLADRRAGVVTADRQRLAQPGTEIIVATDYLAAGHVAYSYARTVHKSQGATADVVLLDGDDLRGRELAYVALSRHRRDVRVFLTAAQPPPDVERHVEPGRQHDDPLEALTERASRSEAQRAALASMTRAGVERRRRVAELARQGPEALAAERTQAEARAAVWLAQRRPGQDQAVAEAEAALRAAEAAWEAERSQEARRALREARQALREARERAARAGVRGAEVEAEGHRPELDRLAELRAAEARARRQAGLEEPARLDKSPDGLELGL